MDDQPTSSPRPKWVAEEAATWLKPVLETLAVEFEVDVETANALPEEARRGNTFQFQRSDPPGTSISVYRKEEKYQRVQGVSARIDYDKHAIVVEPLGDDPFEVTSRVADDTGRRVLMIGDATYEPWQVSRRALRSLFFPLDRPW